uniref:Uncharacterized protein n=1 Tax=Arundo donax TaxID=35708 RepID=A0A0A9GZL8_ARUDO
MLGSRRGSLHTQTNTHTSYSRNGRRHLWRKRCLVRLQVDLNGLIPNWFTEVDHFLLG